MVTYLRQDVEKWHGITRNAHMDVSENSGTPKSSILIGSSIINHPFWGTPILGSPLIYIYIHISKHHATVAALLATGTKDLDHWGTRGGTESAALLGYRWDGVVETREDHICIKKNRRSWFWLDLSPFHGLGKINRPIGTDEDLLMWSYVKYWMWMHVASMIKHSS